MTFTDACVHLGSKVILSDGGVYSLGWYLAWSPCFPEQPITLDGTFSPEDLHAIATFVAEVRAATLEERRTNE